MVKVEPMDAAAIAAIQELRNSGLISRSEARAMMGLPDSEKKIVGELVVKVTLDTTEARGELAELSAALAKICVEECRRDCEDRRRRRV